MSNNTKIVTFIDQGNRTIIGEQENLTETTLTVRNPAILHVQQVSGQDGKPQLSVNVIPLFFREFVGAGSRAGTSWQYNLASITLGIDIDNNPQLLAQYNQLFGGNVQAAPTASQAPAPSKVVKLFE